MGLHCACKSERTQETRIIVKSTSHVPYLLSKQSPSSALLPGRSPSDFH